MSFTDLYAARIKYGLATPGSKEWWEAIREIRAAQRNIINAYQKIVNAAREFVRSMWDAFRPVVESLMQVTTSE